MEQASVGTKLSEHPARLLTTVFMGVIGFGTLLLSLPIATQSRVAASPLTALFTATSATCVTGLILEDTPTYWSGFGQGVILALIQVGGFGIMTMTSLLVIVVARRLGLRQRRRVPDVHRNATHRPPFPYQCRRHRRRRTGPMIECRQRQH